MAPGAMPEAELTEAMIAAAMATADARVCVGSDRCYAFPDRLEDARTTCTPKGRCKVGSMVTRGHTGANAARIVVTTVSVAAQTASADQSPSSSTLTPSGPAPRDGLPCGHRRANVAV